MRPCLPASRNHLAPAILFAAAIFFAPIANATDGVIEINTARAAEGGVTSGDTAGYPVTISQPGSYRLTSDLNRSKSSSDIASTILVTADDVTIDLNGFRIRCTQRAIIGPLSSGSGVSANTIVIAGPTPCNYQVANGDGIGGEGANLTVMNGTIWGMPNDGIDAGKGTLIVNVRAIANGEQGIGVDDGSNVRDSVMRENGRHGLRNFGDHHSGYGGNTISENGATVVGKLFETPPNSNVCDDSYCP